MLSIGDRTRTGVFNVVWPMATAIHQELYVNQDEMHLGKLQNTWSGFVELYVESESLRRIKESRCWSRMCKIHMEVLDNQQEALKNHKRVPSTPGVPRRSPFQVLTGPNVASLR